MESTDSSTGSQQPQLPPGFRFHPTDEELVVHYLKKKAASTPLPVPIIADIDLYKFDPWELPARATFGEDEWYFFSPRDRKYPNGARPNRAATSGYWKATGTDKPVLTSGGNQKVGVKKALVFYGGKPPKGIKTSWIMHEYRLADNKSDSKPPCFDVAKKGSLRLDDWVLCRIYKKTNTPRPIEHDKDEMNDIMQSIPPSMPPLSVTDHEKLQLAQTSNYRGLLENEHNMFDRMMGSDGGSMSQALSTSQLPLVGSSSSVLPNKRALPPLYWNEENGGTSPSAKRFAAENGDGNIGGARTDGTNSIASILGQTTQLHQQAMLGSLADGVFRQAPGINWFS